MEVTQNLRLALAVLIVVGISCSGNGVAAQDCTGDIKNLIEKCTTYISTEGPKVSPSTDCCSALKSANLPCVCNSIHGNMAQLIDNDKLLNVTNSCGVAIVHGSTCGTFVLP